MDTQRFRERNRTHDQIRQHGAIGNLNEGIEITTHGIATRLIAWPGNGFQTESVHVLTVKPGQASERYSYDMAEEALVCLKGKGEVYLRGQWVEIEAGDMVFWPERTEHGVRNLSGDRDFVLVNQISPPQFDLYEAAGFYDRTHCVMNYEAIEAAKQTAQTGNISTENELHLNESHPELRAWNMTPDEIRRDGALLNVYRGAAFGGLDVPMVLILWPGYGVRSTGFHFGVMTPGQTAPVHTHPVADECIINWVGGSEVYIEGEWVQTGPLDASLAPCGVKHGGRVSPNATGLFWPGGFAAPPQLDLYMNTPFYQDGKFVVPEWGTLSAETTAAGLTKDEGR